MDYREGLLLLLSSMLVLRHCTAQPDPNAYQNCTYSRGNFTAKSTYQTNLNLLLSSLSSNAKTISGFCNTTSQNSNKVYGLFLCRGDVTPETCNTCIKAASSNITQRCPTAKEAIIWYEYCMLRYSNQPIFSIMEKEPSICLPNDNNVSKSVQSEFDKIWVDLFNGLVSQAASAAAVGRKYAANEANYTSFEKIYGLVQCTPDYLRMIATNA
ncbi:cysteine-rich receptor-like protein kinase 25 [Macadamia integrifolia]|uniref:cysteine-rich receptor-like protein kinase 25 n=1 Tax=Macadamia integrifolia TaxID=60698 RepID=UPI001C4F73A2|nr:cysteine-rich receptor-like protein kinase 25 [Macadamia integrifolia]